MIQPIFIFSLPRSGSTLLQRILMNSGQATSLGETKPLLRLLGDGDLAARRSVYGEFLVNTSIRKMKRQWSGYSNAYREGVRHLMLNIYAGLAGESPCFIDKTPRYSLITEKIYQTFPDAKFIVLVRHPLAITASMHSTFKLGFWFPEEHSIDFYQGYPLLLQFAQNHKEKIHLVRYEDLVTNPAGELESIGEYLGWQDLPAALEKPLPPIAEGDGDNHKEIFCVIPIESLNRRERFHNNFYRKNLTKECINKERAEIMTSYGYELPKYISRPTLGGWFSGIRDRRLASRHRNQRITEPQWLQRSLEYCQVTHDIDVSWR